jgi:cyclopropane-fatty-acyl-phospholipid synthase
VVTGVTLSEEQLGVARERARLAGLSDRVRFELIDYRDVEPAFDRVVSVGMFEHVGAPNYLAFFEKVRSLLRDDGIALIHSIGRAEPPGLTDEFIRKYIFPGGYIPALSQAVAAIEHSGLWITDVEILRRHYAETLAAWRERFMANRAEIATLYDERFCRMFEYYLATSELSFRTGTTMVMQIQLARHADALPLTRDYMVDEERRSADMVAGRSRGVARRRIASGG